MENKVFFNDVKEAFETNREIYFSIDGIKYHLDYDENTDDCIFIFDEDTGDEYYYGTIKNVYDKFIINKKSFKTYIEEDSFDSFFIV